jgi:fibronectin-binding autotransporter adhesin
MRTFWGRARLTALAAVAVAVVAFPAGAFADSPSIVLSGPLAAGGNGESVAAVGATQISAAVSDTAAGISSVSGSLDGTAVTAASSSSVPCGSTTAGCSGSVSWDFGSAATVGWHTFAVTATNDSEDQQTVTEPFAIIGAPAISGTDAVGQTLTVTPASIPGSVPSGAAQPTYSFEWESCDPAGNECAPIEESTGAPATGASYTLTPGDVGSTLEVIESAAVVGQSDAATVTSASSSLIEPASGPACTESWIPSGGGDWSTASNWSGDAVPSSSDVVCIRGGFDGTFVTISADATIDEIQATQGSVTVQNGATFTIAGVSNGSQIGGMFVGAWDGSTAGTLSVAGALETGGLLWTSGTVSGGGTVTLDPFSGGGLIEPQTSSDSIVLDGTTIVNRGFLGVSCSPATDTANSAMAIVGENGATIENEGGINFNDGVCELQQGSGAPSTLINSGTGELSGPGDPSSAAQINIGWVLDDSAALSSVANANINLFGGESGPIAGQWISDNLDLESGGAYSVSNDLADFGSEAWSASNVTVGPTPGTADGASVDYATFLAGAASAPSLSITAGEWQNGSVTADGPLTLGDGDQVVTIGNLIDSDSAPITVDGTVNAASYTGDDGDLSVATNCDFNVYGSTGLTGSETVSGGSGSTVDFEGALDVASEPDITTSGGLVLGGIVSGTGNLSITVGGAFYEQGGVDITGDMTVEANNNADIDLQGQITAGGTVAVTTGGDINAEGGIQASAFTANAGGDIEAGSLQVTDASLSSPGTITLNDFDTIDNMTVTGGGVTDSGGNVSINSLTVNGEIFDNGGGLNLGVELLAENGAQIINDGWMHATGADLTEGPGAPSQFVTGNSGVLSTYDASIPTIISIPYQGPSVSWLVTAPACTNTWVGGSSGTWDTASNWSVGAVPVSTDVACVTTDAQISVNGSDTAASIQAPAAAITGSSGELDLTSTTGPTLIGSLSLEGATLHMAGPVAMDQALDWTAGTIDGSGTITLGDDATSTIDPASSADAPELDAASLVNDGTLTMGCSTPMGSVGESVLDGANGATLTNDGYFALGDAGSSELCGLEQVGTGTAPELINNDGYVSGQATSYIGWEFANTNDGDVVSATLIAFGGGTAAGVSETGSWDATVDFLSGSYDLSQATIIDDSSVQVGVGAGTGDGDPFDSLATDQPTVNFGTISLPSTTIDVHSGQATIGSGVNTSELGTLNVHGGTTTVADALTVDTALHWTAGTVTGSGGVTLASAATSTIRPTDVENSPLLDGATITNDGALWMDCSTATDGSGDAALDGADGAQIVDSGRFELVSDSAGGVATPCALEQSGGGAQSSLVNDGSISGLDSAVVDWTFTNDGVVVGPPSTTTFQYNSDGRLTQASTSVTG